KLAFAYQITGEEEYAYKAFEFAVVVCDQPTWVHGAHKFNIIYDRVWPWGARDNQVAFGYSQWMDHIVFKIAAIYDWLYPALQKRQRDHIRSALLDKAILPVRGNYEYYWWATAYRCNWCSVCNASLGVAALSLLTEDPQLIDVIAESYNRISKNLDEIRSGGWQEGLSYLFYTIKTSLEFAEALKNVTNGKFNLYNHPRYQDAVKTFIYCQIPPDKSVHFGDSGGGKFGSYNIFNQLIVETGDPLAAWLRKYLTDDKPTDFVSLFKPKFPLKPEVPKVSSIHFPAVDWIIMRSNFIDPEKVVVTAKCGMNDDPHHGHLDAGHFSLYWRGEEFICDHGSAGYDKKYFDKERWDYSLASSIGHNVVHVNGEKQSHCKYKDRPWRNDVGGKIIEFRTNNIRDYALMDPTNAYPKIELKSWRRHIILEKPFITIVLDEVECAKDVEIEVRFHSPVSTFMPFHFANYSFSKP
ncbi:heparinase II/III family protein, partial [bacterium]|nr:heparinase II/III family protein [bacterium]